MDTPSPRRGGWVAGVLAAGVGVALVWWVASSVIDATRPGGAGATPVGPAAADAKPPQAPDPHRAPAPGDGARIDAVLNSAQALVRDGELSKADAVLTSAIGQYPTEPRLYLSRAELLVSQKQPGEAYSMYEKALAIGPREGPIEFDAGTVASMAGRLDRAVEHYQAAQRAMPRDHRPALYLAQVQLKLRRTEEAKANLVLAGTLNPDVAIIWGTLADVELAENKSGLALQHVAKARQLEPRVTLWRLLEARALKRDGRPEEALQTLIGVDDAEKRSGPVVTLMAECYGMLNRPKDAAVLLVDAAGAASEDGALALQAALWLERAGDLPKAGEWAQRAKLLGAPGAEEAAARLAAPSPGTK